MRSSPLVIALLLGAACAGGPAAPASSAPVIANVAPAPAKLRIARVAPRVGSVRTETSVRRGPDEESRKVLRREVLAVEGIVATKQLITYVETSGKDAPLAGKTYVVSSQHGQIQVVPADGTPSGDEDLVREDNRSAGRPDSTLMMVSDRDFTIGAPVTVPAPPSLPPETVVTLTLRSFDATTATFDMAVEMATGGGGVRAHGRMLVDRATGLELLASMALEYRVRDKVEHASLDFEATTE
jgi:hypothetical protein